MNRNPLIGKTFTVIYPEGFGYDGRKEREVIITAVSDDGTVRVDFNNGDGLAMCPGPKDHIWKNEWKATVTQIRRCAFLGEKFYCPEYWFSDIRGKAYCTIEGEL